MNELRQKRSHYTEAISALETDINESEAACGRMLQRHLEIGRAIAVREKQSKDDRESLLCIQQVKAGIDEELDVVLTKISTLVSGSENTL